MADSEAWVSKDRMAAIAFVMVPVIIFGFSRIQFSSKGHSSIGASQVLVSKAQKLSRLAGSIATEGAGSQSGLSARASSIVPRSASRAMSVTAVIWGWALS